MTDAEKREKVMRGLECCALGSLSNCEGCPYTETRCSEHLCGDALALLKKQEPRLMTLDEVLTAEDFVWAEIHTPHKWSWCVIYVKIIPVVSNDEIVRIEEDCGVGWIKTKFEYGKRGFLDGGWRCWSVRPTEEQRKAAAWND